MGNLFGSSDHKVNTQTVNTTETTVNDQKIGASDGSIVTRAGNIHVTNTTSDGASVLAVLNLARDLNAKNLDTIADIIENQNASYVLNHNTDSGLVSEGLGAARSLAEAYPTGGTNILADKFTKLALVAVGGLALIFVLPLLFKKG
jgi:hypothetical protein